MDFISFVYLSVACTNIVGKTKTFWGLLHTSWREALAETARTHNYWCQQQTSQEEEAL